MMGSLFAMSVAALLVVGAQFWYIIVRLILLRICGIPKRKERQINIKVIFIVFYFTLFSYV